VLSQDGIHRKVVAWVMKIFGTAQVNTMSVSVDPIGRVVVCRHDETKENNCIEYMNLKDTQQLMHLHAAISKYFEGKEWKDEQ